MNNLATIIPALAAIMLALASSVPYIARQRGRGHPVGLPLYAASSIVAGLTTLALTAAPARLSPTTSIAGGLLAFLFVVVSVTDLKSRLIPTETCASVAGITSLLAVAHIAENGLNGALIPIIVCGAPVLISALLFLLNKGGLGDVTATGAAFAATWWWAGAVPEGPVIGFLVLVAVMLACYLPPWGKHEGGRLLAAGPPLLAYYLSLITLTSIGA